MQPRRTGHGRLMTNFWDVNDDFVFIVDSWTQKNPVHQYRIVRAPAEEMDMIEYMYSRKRKSPGLSTLDVVDMMKDPKNPEALKIAKRVYKEYVTELRKLEDEIWDMEREMRRRSDISEQSKEEAIAFNATVMHGSRVAFLKDNIVKLKRILMFFTPAATSIAQSMKQKEILKGIPIDEFVDFDNSNKSCCVWHSENTPSMTYYPDSNDVYCFGCNRYGDVFDIIQELHGVDFKGALAILSKHDAQ